MTNLSISIKNFYHGFRSWTKFTLYTPMPLYEISTLEGADITRLRLGCIHCKFPMSHVLQVAVATGERVAVKKFLEQFTVRASSLFRGRANLICIVPILFTCNSEVMIFIKYVFYIPIQFQANHYSKYAFCIHFLSHNM